MRFPNLLISCFLLALIGMTMLSCGNSTYQKSNLTHANTFFYEDGYDECVSNNSNEVKVIDEILDFESKFTAFYNSFILAKYSQISTLVTTKQRIQLSVFFLTQPLILNPVALNLQFQTLIDRFTSSWQLYELYGEILTYGERVIDLSDETMVELSSLVVDLGKLKNHAIRFKHAICKKKQLISNQQYNVLTSINVNKWRNAYLLNENNFFQLAKEDLPTNFWNYFFKISPDYPKLDIECLENSGQYNLMVKVYESNLEHRGMVKEAIESYWQSDDIKVSVNFVSSKKDTVQIHWLNSYSSYVEFSNPPQIYLGEKNHPSLQPKILAHEFGHILGFNDCYVEFFDQSGQFVYYEFNGLNIMCSLNNDQQLKVPDYYLH